MILFVWPKWTTRPHSDSFLIHFYYVNTFSYAVFTKIFEISPVQPETSNILENGVTIMGGGEHNRGGGEELPELPPMHLVSSYCQSQQSNVFKIDLNFAVGQTHFISYVINIR